MGGTRKGERQQFESPQVYATLINFISLPLHGSSSSPALDEMAPSQKNAAKKKKQFHGKPQSSYYSSKRPVGGKGIFITTVRGKESRCAGEAYDLLDEVADRLYPPDRIKDLQDKRRQWLQERAGDATATATATVGDDDDEDEDEDAADTQVVEEQETPLAANLDSDDDDDELDLEASIQKELAALKAGHGGKVAPTKARKQQPGGGGGDKAQARRERPRFQSIQTDTECREYLFATMARFIGEPDVDAHGLWRAVCFIATAWPYDPVELTQAIIAQVRETGQSRTR